MNRWNRIALFTSVLILCLWAGAVLHAAGEGDAFSWSSNEPLKIVIPPSPTPVERFAAEELKNYLNKITGIAPAVGNSCESGEKAIILGTHDENKDLEPEQLDPDEFIIATQSHRIRIVGGRRPTVVDSEGKEHPQERGTLYGAYELLERLGVRWYRPEPWGEVVPSLKQFTIPPGREKQSPAYRYRAGGSVYCYNPDGTAEQHAMAALWATRNRINTNTGTPPEYGGYYQQGFYHSYGYYVPQGRYFKDHPEYFALIDGKRSSDINAQLCLSNPDVFKIVVDAIVKNATDNPGIGVASLDPNDLGLWCECDKCRAMDAPITRDGYGVAMSNRVCRFNNLVAKAVAEKIPGLKIGWLAYNRHSIPPTSGSPFEPNTMVQIAAYAGAFSDYSRQLDDETSLPNRQFLNLVKSYGNLTEIGTYEYWSDYIWPGPLPLIHVMVDRLQKYRHYNVTGVYSEMHSDWGPLGISNYFYGRLLWNPDLDLKKELDDYYANYYGPAATPMKAYHEALETASENGPYYGSGGSEIPALFTDELLERLKGFMEEARHAVAGKAPYERRLLGVSASFEFAVRYHEILRIKKESRFVEAQAKLQDLKKFFFAQPTGEVFENGPALAKAGWFMIFSNLEKELKQNVTMFQNFKGAKLVQQHDKHWRFQIDPEDKGRNEQWNDPEYPDDEWGYIDATGWWQSQGFPDYHGAAWYRRKFEAPLLPDKKRLILYFDAVDGDAEVWLNGKKVGEHLLGPEGAGYDQPFFFDMTRAIKNTGLNSLAIRVKKSFAVGGINKGVKIYAVDKILVPTASLLQH